MGTRRNEGADDTRQSGDVVWCWCPQRARGVGDPAPGRRPIAASTSTAPISMTAAIARSTPITVTSAPTDLCTDDRRRLGRLGARPSSTCARHAPRHGNRQLHDRGRRPEVPVMDGSAEGRSSTRSTRPASRSPSQARRYIKVLKAVRIELRRQLRRVPNPRRAAGSRSRSTSPIPLIGRQRYAADMTPTRFRRDIWPAPAPSASTRDVNEPLGPRLHARRFPRQRHRDRRGQRVMNPEGLRYGDEFVRHKALDAMGDLALAGAPILGCYRSYRGGHRLNVRRRGDAACRPRRLWSLVEMSRSRPRGVMPTLPAGYRPSPAIFASRPGSVASSRMFLPPFRRLNPSDIVESRARFGVDGGNVR